jgi:hypothetical protein
MESPVMARGLQTQIGDFGARAPESPSLPFSGKGNKAIWHGRIAYKFKALARLSR